MAKEVSKLERARQRPRGYVLPDMGIYPRMALGELQLQGSFELRDMRNVYQNCILVSALCFGWKRGAAADVAGSVC